ncbi:MAG: hypothetical protein ACRD5M_12810 [Candidatus Acidiferrales bacterium]
MTTTFKKRQKEMKRMDKARMKAERRAQKKLDPAGTNTSNDNIAWDEQVVPQAIDPAFEDSEPQPRN